MPHGEIYMGGPPVDNVAIDLEGQKTLRQLAFFSALMGLGLSYWCMRQLYLTVLIIACAVYSAAISLSLVYFMGSSMDAILYTMPPVVYTASLSGAIHIINYYRNAVHDGGLGRRCRVRGQTSLGSVYFVRRHDGHRPGFALHE